MSTEHTYNLPGAVAAAISTQRFELINLLIKKVRQGEALPAEHVIGVLEAFRDLLQARSDDHRRAQILERRLKALDNTAKGLETIQRSIRVTLDKIGSNAPLAQDEEE